MIFSIGFPLQTYTILSDRVPNHKYEYQNAEDEECCLQACVDKRANKDDQNASKKHQRRVLTESIEQFDYSIHWCVVSLVVT